MLSLKLFSESELKMLFVGDTENNVYGCRHVEMPTFLTRMLLIQTLNPAQKYNFRGNMNAS